MTYWLRSHNHRPVMPDPPDTAETFLADMAELKQQLQSLTADKGMAGLSQYLPPPFTGDILKNITEFFQKLELYANFQGYDDKKKLLPILLTGCASQWFADLDHSKYDSWKSLKDATIANYDLKLIGFLQESILMDRQQQFGESVKL